MIDGPIHLGTQEANELGFTPDKFDGWLWYDKFNDRCTISMIISLNPGKGNVKKLIDTLKSKFSIIDIPCPSIRMEKIAEKSEFKKVILTDNYNDPYDLGPCRGMRWIKIKNEGHDSNKT